MAMTTPPATRLGSAPRTAAQQRIVASAHKLFAEHGISGTSLQMIADDLGVTKAAVYHQYRAKDEIVLAVAASELRTLEEAVDAAESAPSHDAAVEMLLTMVVELAVSRRHRALLLQHDPVMARLLAEHEPFRSLMDRVYMLLSGDDPARSRVRAAMLASAIGASVVHPLVVDLDDETLRAELLELVRRLVRPTPGR